MNIQNRDMVMLSDNVRPEIREAYYASKADEIDYQKLQQHNVLPFNTAVQEINGTCWLVTKEENHPIKRMVFDRIIPRRKDTRIENLKDACRNWVAKYFDRYNAIICNGEWHYAKVRIYPHGNIMRKTSQYREAENNRHWV